jgi:hypothetical protein
MIRIAISLAADQAIASTSLRTAQHAHQSR